MAKIVGIDLGTTNSEIAIWLDDRPQIIPNAEGDHLTPSMVALDLESHELIVGCRARIIADENPACAVYSIKRFMGRRFQEQVVQDDLHALHIFYEVEEAHRRQGGIEVILGNKHLTPQEVSAKILQKLKTDAEHYLGEEITQAVVTVPAYFHDSQRQATRDAGRIAGLDVKRVINEPTAACLAFGYKKLAEERKKVAVYDLGGGTFDISILEVGRGPFRVRSTNGDTHLGGDDIDWLIVDWILDKIGKGQKEKLQQDMAVLAHLRAAAEHAKVALSSAENTVIQVVGPLSATFGIQDLELELSRATLEAKVKQLIDKTLATCHQALQDAHLETTDIQEVLLVGGPTRMPFVRQAVKNLFRREPEVSIDPEEVVALGAAVQAAILAGEATGLKLADVVPLSLGLDSKGLMDTLIPRNTSVPIRKTKIYTTPCDNQESVEIKVYQGEHPLVADNIKLGSFILSGIEPAPKGEPEIEVTFQVDQDGILHVSGKDLRTDNFKEITITESVRLSDEDIEAMIRNATDHAIEYAAQRRQAEAQLEAGELAERLTSLLVEKVKELPENLVSTIRNTLDITTPGDWVTHLQALQGLWQQVAKAKIGQSEVLFH
ncbi:MAG: molecular chaperone DnaK [Candidatus Competibacteraceae bacterium]